MVLSSVAGHYALLTRCIQYSVIWPQVIDTKYIKAVATARVLFFCCLQFGVCWLLVVFSFVCLAVDSCCLRILNKVTCSSNILALRRSLSVLLYVRRTKIFFNYKCHKMDQPNMKLLLIWSLQDIQSNVSPSTSSYIRHLPTILHGLSVISPI